jgi:putative ATP-dependent endonuclease of OLD family
MADITQVRSLSKIAPDITVHQISHKITKEDKKIISREIMAKRGEIIFSKAIILCEGVTEEQVIPAMFEIYLKKSFWDAGVSCISVGGKNYSPFVKLACSLGIPTHIISDNDGSTKNEVEAQIRRLKNDTGLTLDSDIYGIQYLGDSNDFEAELIAHGLRDEINEALVLCETKGSDNQRYRQAKTKEICLLSDLEIITRMRDSKSSYSGFLADVLRDNSKNKTCEELLPSAIKNSLDTVKIWLAK